VPCRARGDLLDEQLMAVWQPTTRGLTLTPQEVEELVRSNLIHVVFGEQTLAELDGFEARFGIRRKQPMALEKWKSRLPPSPFQNGKATALGDAGVTKTSLCVIFWIVQFCVPSAKDCPSEDSQTNSSSSSPSTALESASRNWK